MVYAFCVYALCVYVLCVYALCVSVLHEVWLGPTILSSVFCVSFHVACYFLLWHLVPNCCHLSYIKLMIGCNSPHGIFIFENFMINEIFFCCIEFSFPWTKNSSGVPQSRISLSLAIYHLYIFNEVAVVLIISIL